MVKLNTTLFLLAGMVLAVLHYFSLELYLYWRYLWLDIPMHFLGGIVVALGYLTLRDFFTSWSASLFTLYKTLAVVILVAITWEVFEVLIGVVFEEDRYVIDTLTDLFLGVTGGALGYYLGNRVGQLDNHG